MMAPLTGKNLSLAEIGDVWCRMAHTHTHTRKCIGTLLYVLVLRYIIVFPISLTFISCHTVHMIQQKPNAFPYHCTLKPSQTASQVLPRVL